MKKYLLLLLISSFAIAQVNPQKITKLAITANVTSTTATKVNVQEADGVINTISKADLIDVLEFASAINLPITGVAGKIYVTIDNGKMYRWNGTIYVEVSSTEKFIKSNESLSLAQRKGDVLHGILDRYTGEQITLTKVTGTPIVDGVIYFQLGTEYFKRNFDYVRPEWFGLDGVNDQVAINKALAINNVDRGNNENYKNGLIVALTSGKEYFTSGTIEITTRQQLLGNGARIVSTSTTNVIKGIDSFLGNLYHHKHVIVRDLDIVTSTAINPIDLKGFINSEFTKIKILMFNCTANSIAVKMVHGINNYDQCYFNRFEGYEITMLNNLGVNLGTGILIGGVSGTSGANVNTVGYGIITGRDLIGIKIDNNSNGNTIISADFEAYDKFSQNIAIQIVNGNYNNLISPHVENYYKPIEIKATSNANTVNNENASVCTVKSTDQGLLNTWNMDGSYSVGNPPVQNTFPQIQVSGVNYSAYVFESKNTSVEARNWALRAGFDGNDFALVKSTIKGGDPLPSTDYAWKINSGGFFVLPKSPKIELVYGYPTNTLALADGFTQGTVFKNPSDGTLRVVQAVVSSENEVAHISDVTPKANIASPTFTGTPTAPTAIAGTNTTQLATTAFVQSTTNANAVLLAGSQSVTGRKTFTSDNTTVGGININNNRTATTAGTSDQAGLFINNLGTTGLLVDNMGGNGITARSLNGGSAFIVQTFSTGVGLELRNQGGTGNLLSAELGTTVIKSTGEFSSSLPIIAPNIPIQIRDFYTDVSNSLLTETDLYSHTTISNRLNATGQKLIAVYAGTFNDATASSQIKVVYGGVVIGDTGALTMSIAGAWIVNASIMRTGATTARAMVNISTPGASTASYTKYTSLTGLTFTNTNVIKITGTASGATGGDADITATYGNIIWQPAAL